jgi:diguanylate cyclase (GGDEF)-like protein
MTGIIHLVISQLMPGADTVAGVAIYNLILVATSIWLLMRREVVMACAIGAWALSSIYSALVDFIGLNMIPILNGLGFLAFYPLIFYYILRSQQLVKISRTQILDSLIITVGISALLSTLALSATSTATTTSEKFLLTLYPIGDLLLIFLLVLVGMRSGVSQEYFILLLAIVIFTLSDLGYLWLYSRSEYLVGGLVDEGWLIALLLCASAPKLPAAAKKTLNTYPPIFIALALALSMLGWYALNPAEVSHLALIPAIGTLLLAFIRMAFALEEAELGKFHRTLAVTDELTGVANRREFLDRLAKLPQDGSRALLLLDLDGFKGINDKFGHGTGDRTLQEAAHRFELALTEESYLARLGGDEFAVLTFAPLERAEQVAERLRRALAAPLYVGEREITLSVSIGVALIEGGSNPLERADAEMYLAKRTAR